MLLVLSALLYVLLFYYGVALTLFCFVPFRWCVIRAFGVTYEKD